MTVSLAESDFIVGTLTVVPVPVECQAGEYPNELGTRCGCGAERTRTGDLYTNIDGVEVRACELCPDGEEPQGGTLTTDATSCAKCSAGVSSAATGHRCQACAPGKRPSEFNTYCEVCEAGKFSVSGTECTVCSDWQALSMPPPSGLVPALVFGGAKTALECACPPGS